VERKLNDGRRFTVIKNFYEPDSLHARLRCLGWNGWVRSSGQFFIFGLIHQRSAAD
jgi:hypothetical protein